MAKDYSEYGERKPCRVYCSICKEWIYEDAVEFLDISEDFEGKDLLRFNCPSGHKQQESHRIG